VCHLDDTPEQINNYCFIDSVVAYTKNDNFRIFSGGCPDTAVTEPSGCNMTDSECPSPMLQKYVFSLPFKPRVRRSGPSPIPVMPVNDGSKKLVVGPIGVTVNGVLMYSHDEHSQLNGIDTCGGQTDQFYRYQYHYPPICLMNQMHVTVPESPLEFLDANTVDEQILQWPATGSPSPLLGYALDGFPIFGPYNSTGQLQVAGEGEVLDECNFDSRTRRYHITANSPFFPSCLVGKPGSFESIVTPQGMCSTTPQSRFCTGSSCRPNYTKVPSSTPRFIMDAVWTVVLVIACILLCILLATFAYRLVFPSSFLYPSEKIILSVLPALVMLLASQSVLKLFFGQSRDQYDYDLDMVPIDTYLNEAVASFLTVTGVLYSLIVSQLFTLINEKFVNIRDALGDELASCRQIVLCIKAIHLTDTTSKQVSLKLKAVKVVVWYVTQISKKWGQPLTAEDNSLDVLYGLLPLVSKLCDDTDRSFNYHVADRIVDCLNDLANAKYHRLALEDQSVPSYLWYLQYLLSTAMFLGVMLIYTGSQLLNEIMCFVVALLVGMIAMIVTDMDMPYDGLINLSQDPVYELINNLAGSQNVATLSTNLDKKNSRFFKTDLGRISSGTMSKADMVSSRRISMNERRSSLSSLNDMLSTKLSSKMGGSSRMGSVKFNIPDISQVISPAYRHYNTTADCNEENIDTPPIHPEDGYEVAEKDYEMNNLSSVSDSIRSVSSNGGSETRSLRSSAKVYCEENTDGLVDIV